MARFSSLRWRGNRPSITGTSARAARERGTAIGFFVVASGAWCRKATAAIGTAGRAPWGLAERSECVARWQSSGAVHWKMSSDVRGQEQRPGEGIGGSDRSGVPAFAAAGPETTWPKSTLRRRLLELVPGGVLFMQFAVFGTLLCFENTSCCKIWAATRIFV